jgi:hypothetical protein
MVIYWIKYKRHKENWFERSANDETRIHASLPECRAKY